MSIEINNVSKYFGDFKALEQIRLSIKKGELIALLDRRALVKPLYYVSLQA